MQRLAYRHKEWEVYTNLRVNPSTRASFLDTLGVPVVGSLAATLGAALSTGEALATALSVHGSAASSGGSLLGRGSRSRSDNSGHGGLSRGSGGGRGRGDLLLGGSRGRATSGSTALPDSRAGHGEGLAAVVDAEVGVGVGGLVSTGELDHGARLAATTAGNLDLHAGDVVLGLVDVGAVNTNVLEADEVLAVGGVLGDGGSDSVLVVGAPGVAGEVTAAAVTLIEDLEPVARSVVRLDAAGSSGHVDQGRARVLELGTNTELGGNVVAGLDGQNLDLATSLSGTLVADDVGTVGGGAITDVGGRVGGELDGVVRDLASRRADVFELRLGNTTDEVGVKEVVGAGHLGDGGENDGGGGELHSG